MLNFRSPRELTKALDAWIKQQPEPRPSRSEAIRRALSDWLTGIGLLKQRDGREGATGREE
jgi:Arc/MetJ-type ribon-helix-helix transcriptional regulator